MALLIDHRRQVVRVYRPLAPVVVHGPADRIALDEIAPGAALDVAQIFSALNPD